MVPHDAASTSLWYSYDSGVAFTSSPQSKGSGPLSAVRTAHWSRSPVDKVRPLLPHCHTSAHHFTGGKRGVADRFPGTGLPRAFRVVIQTHQKPPGYIFRHGTPSTGDKFSRRGRGGGWAFSFFPGAGHGRICRTMFYIEARPDDFCTKEGRINMCPPCPHTLRMLRVPKARHGRLRAKCMSVGG